MLPGGRVAEHEALSTRPAGVLQGWDAGLATGGCVREGVSGEAGEVAGPDWEVLMSLLEPGFSPKLWEGSQQGHVDLYFL